MSYSSDRLRYIAKQKFPTLSIKTAYSKCLWQWSVALKEIGIPRENHHDIQ